MKLLIDLASFLNYSPAELANCAKCLRDSDHVLQYLWRIPEDLSPPPILTRVIDLEAQAECMHLVDLNGIPQSLAAMMLDDFIANRQVQALIQAEKDTALTDLYELIYHPSFVLIPWQPNQTELPVVHQPAMSVADAISEISSKPDLAIVSPYPPQKSGVADYVAQLLPALSAHYNCILVISDGLPEAEAIRFPGPVISASEFLKLPALHQRVLYQIGNSPGHLYALPLLESIPGVVTLHDFYMGDALLYEELVLKKKDAFLKRLLVSHGLNVLSELATKDLAGSAARYPCNLPILKDATLLAIHAEYVKNLAYRNYGQFPDSKFFHIPFPKDIFAGQTAQQRSQLREVHGIGLNDFVVSTFGFGVPTKRHDVLIQSWMESGFARDPHAHLLIVGEYPNSQYLEMMQQLCKGYATNIRFVGFVDEPVYREYLAITDLAVQLRVNSRGETSAAIMDCLAGGVPVIANDHGTVIELPDNLVWKITDPPLVAELMTALEYLHSNPALLADRRMQGLAYLQQKHSLDIAAWAYHKAIEHAALQSVGIREKQLIKAAHQQNSTAAEAISLARSINFNRPRLGKKQLLIDITEVATHDLRTGIQRVVRSILAELVQMPPEGFEICPIYLDRQQVYRHARQFMLRQHQLDCPSYADEPVSVHAGDHYLGIDLHPTSTADAANIYKSWRAHGVRTTFVLYDLLPVQHPEWFPPIVLPEFTRWLHVIADYGDRIIAISQSVAKDMRSWLDQQQIPSDNQPVVDWFHLGADIRASIPTGGLPEDAPHILNAIGADPSFLMVATVEPRKGHAQALDAFEVLWGRGVEANLIIVGKKGWMVDSLADRILAHPALNKRLFWLQGISDEYLEEIYPRCTALLAASEGEGFGLPIIEAAQHQLPVIARDIPVFREVGGEGVSYFSAEKSEQLADHLETWIKMPVDARPQVSRVQWQTWRDSASQIADGLEKFRYAPPTMMRN